MTDERLLEVFGCDGPEECLLRLAVECPSFGRGDLLLALRQLRDMPDGVSEAMSAFRKLGGWGAFAAASWGTTAPVSFDEIFPSRRKAAIRNVFRVMFETTAWDEDILFQPGFFEEVAGIRDRLSRESRASGYRDRRKADDYEVFAEMADRLSDKIRLRSGV